MVPNEHLCTGTLFPDGVHVLTAAHCYKNETPPQGTGYVRFETGSSEVFVPYNTQTGVSIHPSFQFDTIGPNSFLPRARFGFDIAIITLDCNILCMADMSGIARYDVFRPGIGSEFADTEIVGYGYKGNAFEGNIFPLPGQSAEPFRKRAGRNRFESYGFDLNDRAPESGGPPIPSSLNEFPAAGSLAYDFDNDTAGGPCTTANHPQHPLNGCDAMAEYFSEAQHDDPHGHGNMEVANSVGDSGGPHFAMVNGNRRIAGVTSHLFWSGLKTDIVPIDGADDAGNFGEMFIATRVAYDGVSPTAIDGNLDWIDSVVDIKAPKVTSIRIGATETYHVHHNNGPAVPDFESILMKTGVDTEGKAAQYRPIAFSRANKITVNFSEPVKYCAANGGSLLTITNTARDPASGLPITTYPVSQPSACNTNPNAMSSSVNWIIQGVGAPTAYDRGFGWLSAGNKYFADQITLNLSGITDAGGVRLDSEWKNPNSLDDTVGVTSFPSGDGDSGSANGPSSNVFQFTLNVLPGDLNQDAVVDGSDFNLWNANKFTNTASNQSNDNEYSRGDINADGVIDGSDFNIWNNFKFTGFATGSSIVVYTPPTSWQTNFNNLLQQYQIYVNGQVNTSLSASIWNAFGNDLVVLFTTL